MGGDLPDYSRKVIVVYEGTITSGEVKCDHWKIKGLTLKDPYIALSLPMSVENPALAYDAVNDRFKVDIQAITLGTIDVNVTDKWARQLGLVDLSRVLGAALSHSNPVISRLTNGSAFIDPRDRNWTITEALARSWLLTSADVVSAVQSGSWNITNLLNPHPVSLSTLLNPHPVSLASIPNPSNLDIAISLLSRETTLAALSDKITNPLPVSLSTLLNPHPITQTNETLLKATVTQAAKDRTISSVDATATPLQISLAALNGNSAALYTPAAGKAIRIKFISLEQSADVDLGYRFGAAGDIYYLRTTKGVYVSNLIGCNNQGAADAALYLNSSAATNVKGYIMLVEV